VRPKLPEVACNRQRRSRRLTGEMNLSATQMSSSEVQYKATHYGITSRFKARPRK
jgi:hypothetical protein